MQEHTFVVKLATGGSEFVKGTSFDRTKMNELVIRRPHPNVNKIFMQHEWVEAAKID